MRRAPIVIRLRWNPLQAQRTSGLMAQDNIESDPDQHDWWEDIDVSSLIDLEAFHRFLYNCDHLLECSSSDDEEYDAASQAASRDRDLRRLWDEQPKLGEAPQQHHRDAPADH